MRGWDGVEFLGDPASVGRGRGCGRAGARSGVYRTANGRFGGSAGVSTGKYPSLWSHSEKNFETFFIASDQVFTSRGAPLPVLNKHYSGQIAHQMPDSTLECQSGRGEWKYVPNKHGC